MLYDYTIMSAQIKGRRRQEVCELRGLVARSLISYMDIAEAYGCTVGWISAIFRERRTPSPAVLTRLRDAVRAVLEGRRAASQGQA